MTWVDAGTGAGRSRLDTVACTGGAKPPYRVPSMLEIRNGPRAGLVAVSTFSGCGGSSLGLRMAGFNVRWANEFVPEALEVYLANFHDTFVSNADIRSITARDVKAYLGQCEEIDLMEGSPPCAAFSMAGMGESARGRVRSYSTVEQQVDDLPFHFVRLVRELYPRTFIMENVDGLGHKKSRPYLDEIERRMILAGYRVGAKIVDAQWLGVPQVRRRTIFVGVRNDLGYGPVFPEPLPYRYSIADVFPAVVNGMAVGGVVESEAWMGRYAIGDEWKKLSPHGKSRRYFQLYRPPIHEPCPTIVANGGKPGFASVAHPTECRKWSIAELKRLSGFPADFNLTGTYRQQWERVGRAVPPPMMAMIAATIRDRILIPWRAGR